MRSPPSDPNEWVARLKVPGIGFLTSFTSEVTQKGGSRLVLISILTISLATKLVDVTEGNFVGLKFLPSRFANVLALISAACCYLFVLYAFDLYRDWKTSHYRRLPDLVEYYRLWHDLGTDLDLQRTKCDAVSDQVRRLIEQRGEKLKAWPPTPDLPRLDPQLSPEEMEAAFLEREDRLEEWNRQREEFLLDLESDGLKERLQEQSRLDDDETLKTLSARNDDLSSLMTTMRRIDRIRFGTEVFFPCGLALIAIVLAAIRLTAGETLS